MKIISTLLHRVRHLLLIGTVLVAQPTQGLAQTEDAADFEPVETELTETEEEAIEADTDGSLDDADSSIEIDEDQRGLSLRSDVRIGYSSFDVDERDNSNAVDDVLRARWRVKGTFGVLPYMRASVRVAGLCSNVECSPNFVLEDFIPTPNGMADGDITLDEAYLHWYRREKFDLAFGRMQTKFVARGGVYANRWTVTTAITRA